MLMRCKKLPAVMCVGRVVSYRNRAGEPPKKPGFLSVVWLQDDFLPYFSPENEAAFREIEWDKHCVGRQVPSG